jgi:RNA polymerase sigma factor (sigma-70 family)
MIHDLLTAEEEIDLITCARAGDTAALESLVEHNQRLVFSIANRYFHSGFGGDQDLEDLAQWGNMGMIHAIRKFDARRGTRFSTYAVHWIDAYIRRYAGEQARTISMTQRDTERLRKIRRSRSALTIRLQRAPTAAEIAADCDMDAAYVADWLPALTAHVRLDREVDHAAGNDDALHEIISAADDDHDPERALERKELAELLGRLDPRCREVINRRFFNEPPESRAHIAQQLGVSVDCVRRLEQQALEIIRPHFGA